MILSCEDIIYDLIYLFTIQYLTCSNPAISFSYEGKDDSSYKNPLFMSGKTMAALFRTWGTLMVMCYVSFGKDSGCLTSIDDFTYFDLVTLGKEKFPYLRCTTYAGIAIA